MRGLTIVSVFATLFMVFTPASVMAQTAKSADPKFPLVLNKVQQLHSFGLDLKGTDDKRPPAFPHVCYVYGGEAHTVYLISLSDAFLKRHTDRGFTRESTCLGLVSQVRFDPDTGKRLPTYVIKYEDKIQKALAIAKKQKLPPKETRWTIDEEGGVTDELPLVVPDCFKNGTPYLDCTWKFGWSTGKPISAATRKASLEFGQTYDRQMQDALQSGKLEGSAQPYDQSHLNAFLPIAGYWGQSPLYPGQPESLVVPGSLYERGHIRITWTVVSPKLPRGYGYALNATGELGPSVSAEAVSAALDNTTPPPQITDSMVDRLLGWLAPSR